MTREYLNGVFEIGWRDGAEGRACSTARQVAERFPAWGHEETNLYLNGAEDGAKRETFRLYYGVQHEMFGEG